MKFKHILVATDLCDSVREGFPHAASWGRQFNARVTLLYVETDPELLTAMPVANHDAVMEAAIAKRDQKLAEAKAAIEGYGASCDVALVAGDPKRAITAFAEEHDVDLIVVTKHSRFLERLRKLGSTTARILRTSRIPMLVVHSGDSPMSPSHLMIAHDVTEGSADGLQAALDLAAAWEAKVTAVHAVDRHGAVSLFGADLPGTLPTAEQLVAHYQAALVDQLNARQAQNFEVHARVAGAMPVGEALSGAAEQIGADLICIPTVSRNAFERILLGSTTERLVTEANVPVFVMPQTWLAPDDRDRSLPVEPATPR